MDDLTTLAVGTTLTEEICKWITSPEKFPEHVFWIPECEAAEVVTVGVMSTCLLEEQEITQNKHRGSVYNRRQKEKKDNVLCNETVDGLILTYCKKNLPLLPPPPVKPSLP